MKLRKMIERIREALKRGRWTGASRKQSARFELERLEDRTVPTIVFNPKFPGEMMGDGHGQLLANVPIELIFNGSYWTDPVQGGQRMMQVQNALTGILSSPYLNGTTEYSTSLPGTPFLHTVSNDPNTLSNDFNFFTPTLLLPPPPPLLDPPVDFTGTLSGNVNWMLDNTDLPENSSALYLVVTSPGIKSQPFQLSSNEPDGFHAWFPDLDTWAVPNPGFPLGIGPPFLPASHPSFFTAWVRTQSNDDGTLKMDEFTQALSHELVESITDPGGGFTIPGGGVSSAILDLLDVCPTRPLPLFSA